ncbi:hypothetical protein PsYK624_165070 [Phanerochaete sordida]|uniref:Uncharacterized protein n=1 Tax=Phanerochaete sordida TaxID=48140 RepID=A0A9P3LM59_9APHY|nr:hypothetical protein PsYK624_165070 [Phanerochaete sordida]
MVPKPSVHEPEADSGAPSPSGAPRTRRQRAVVSTAIQDDAEHNVAPKQARVKKGSPKKPPKKSPKKSDDVALERKRSARQAPASAAPVDEDQAQTKASQKPAKRARLRTHQPDKVPEGSSVEAAPHAQPGQATPDPGAASYVPPAYVQPGQAAPDPGAASYVPPAYVQPGQVAPDPGAASYVPPAYVQPGQVAPDPGAASYVPPAYAQPGQAAPDPGAASYVPPAYAQTGQPMTDPGIALYVPPGAHPGAALYVQPSYAPPGQTMPGTAPATSWTSGHGTAPYAPPAHAQPYQLVQGPATSMPFTSDPGAGPHVPAGKSCRYHASPSTCSPALHHNVVAPSTAVPQLRFHFEDFSSPSSAPAPDPATNPAATTSTNQAAAAKHTQPVPSTNRKKGKGPARAPKPAGHPGAMSQTNGDPSTDPPAPPTGAPGSSTSAQTPAASPKYASQNLDWRDEVVMSKAQRDEQDRAHQRQLNKLTKKCQQELTVRIWPRNKRPARRIIYQEAIDGNVLELTKELLLGWRFPVPEVTHSSMDIVAMVYHHLSEEWISVSYGYVYTIPDGYDVLHLKPLSDDDEDEDHPDFTRELADMKARMLHRQAVAASTDARQRAALLNVERASAIRHNRAITPSSLTSTPRLGPMSTPATPALPSSSPETSSYFGVKKLQLKKAKAPPPLPPPPPPPPQPPKLPKQQPKPSKASGQTGGHINSAARPPAVPSKKHVNPASPPRSSRAAADLSQPPEAKSKTRPKPRPVPRRNPSPSPAVRAPGPAESAGKLVLTHEN